MTDYDGFQELAREPRLSSRRTDVYFSRLTQEERERLLPLRESVRIWTLFQDQPDHMRLKRLLSKAFALRHVGSLETEIARITEDLLDDGLKGGSLELMTNLAYPLPVMVISRLLGIPSTDAPELKGWSRDFSVFFGATKPGFEPAHLAQLAVERMGDHLRPLISERRREPREDLLSALIAAEDGGKVLSESELLASAFMILFAGHETTMNLIGNATLVLTRLPEIQAALRRDASLIPAFVEEVLRYESPVHWQTRVLNDDLEYCGHAFKKGEWVALVHAAANRDPKKFFAPDEFRLDRGENLHLAFGYGPHFCPGSELARMETRIAVAALLRRLPRIALDEGEGRGFEWQDNAVFRGPGHLWLQGADA